MPMRVGKNDLSIKRLKQFIVFNGDRLARRLARQNANGLVFLAVLTFWFARRI
jgi:hypothetical protein